MKKVKGTEFVISAMMNSGEEEFINDHWSWKSNDGLAFEKIARTMKLIKDLSLCPEDAEKIANICIKHFQIFWDENSPLYSHITPA